MLMSNILYTFREYVALFNKQFVKSMLIPRHEKTCIIKAGINMNLIISLRLNADSSMYEH